MWKCQKVFHIKSHIIRSKNCRNNIDCSVREILLFVSIQVTLPLFSSFHRTTKCGISFLSTVCCYIFSRSWTLRETCFKKCWSYLWFWKFYVNNISSTARVFASGVRTVYHKVQYVSFSWALTSYLHHSKNGPTSLLTHDKQQ